MLTESRVYAFQALVFGISEPELGWPNLILAVLRSKTKDEFFELRKDVAIGNKTFE
jgi:hypothetical protein